jgi:hypothetical protein
MRGRSRAAEAVLVLALLSAGCDDSAQRTLPDIASCDKDWENLSELHAMPGLAPNVLRWRDGVLYYVESSGLTQQIVALDDTGGTPRPISSDAGRTLWIEGDAILYSRSDQLFSVPIAGGSSERVSDGETFSSADGANVTFANQTLDESFLYWTLHRYTEPTWSAWRMPRAGGHSEQLGALPDDAGPLSALMPSSDQLLVAGNDGDTYALPRDGGDVRTLPTIGAQRKNVMWSRYLGAAERGILWAVAQQGSNGKEIPYDVVLARPDRKTETIWPTKSRVIVPDHAWPDVSGNWIITALERFSDGELHTSVWSADSKNAKRLACDIGAEDASGYAVAAAVTEDAIFLVVDYFHPSQAEADGGAEEAGWKLVKIRAPLIAAAHRGPTE